ncbi:MAG: GNAT family N-acetyltransferase, partial [Candidatus Rokuibacteriota bacterium]
ACATSSTRAFEPDERMDTGGDAGPVGPRWSVARASAGDLPRLAALLAASPLLRRYGVTHEAALQALERARGAGDLLLVAGASGGLAEGLAWVIASPMLAGAAYLRLLLVAESAQGSGLGARLLAAAEGGARERANHMFLLVTADNAGARRFYERWGYRHVGDLPEHAVASIHEALYHKALRPHGERIPA